MLAQRKTSETSLQHMAALKNASEASRTARIMEVHKERWLQQAIDLEDNRLLLDRDLNDIFDRVCTGKYDSDTRQLFASLSAEASAQRDQTDDLCVFLEDTVHDMQLASKDVEAASQMLGDLRQLIDLQCDSVLDLQHDALDLEDQLRNHARHMRLAAPQPDGTPATPVDITSSPGPREDTSSAFFQHDSKSRQLYAQLSSLLDNTSNADLGVSIAADLEQLDDIFAGKLAGLRRSHSEAIADEFGGWNEEDHIRFTMIRHQYLRVNRPVSGPKMVGAGGLSTRALFFDRLQYDLPHYTRQQLLAHEAFVDAYEFYDKRRRATERDWRTNREALVRDAIGSLEASARIQQERLSKDAEQERWRQICVDRAQRVLAWRKERLARIAEEERLQDEARMKEEQRRAMEDIKMKEENERRSREIQEYRESKLREARAKEEMYAERVRMLQPVVEAQAKRNAERVEHRHDEYELKLEALRLAEQRKLEEQAALEARLDALRSLVQVNVEADPERLVSHTVASKAAMKEGLEHREWIEQHAGQLQRGLAVAGYSDAQIMSDKRFRLQQALHAAGLANSEYARQVLKGVEPARAPRPDMKSTVFAKPSEMQ